MFLLQVLFSAILSSNLEMILLSNIQFILLTGSIVFIEAHNTSDYSIKIFKIFLPLAIILTIYSIIMLVISPNFTLSPWGIKSNTITLGPIKFIQLVFGKPGDYGYSSMTNNPNAYGYICALALILNNTSIYSKRSKIIQIACNIVCIVGVLLSNSRGAIVLILIMLYMFLIFKNYFINKISKLKFYLYNLTGLLIIFILVVFRNPMVESVVNTIYDTNGRIEIWNLLIKNTVEKNLLFGTGIGSNSHLIISSVDTDRTFSAFNVYISTFTELGLIGLAFLIFWILYTLKIQYDNLKKSVNIGKLRFENEFLIYTFLISTYVIAIVENKFMNSSAFHCIWIYISLSTIKRNKQYRSFNYIEKSIFKGEVLDE